jgi:hypothetical protein
MSKFNGPLNPVGGSRPHIPQSIWCRYFRGKEKDLLAEAFNHVVAKKGRQGSLSTRAHQSQAIGGDNLLFSTSSDESVGPADNADLIALLCSGEEGGNFSTE